MTATFATARGRALAESLMVDAGTAGRPTGGYWFNPVFQRDELDTTPLFASPCKIQSKQVQPGAPEVGGRTATTIRVELHLPATSDPLTVGDLFTVTAAGPLSTSVVGVQWRILAPVGKSFATARRYEVERVVS